MMKRIISLIVLALYLHGLSGYTMSFHTCTITGFQNVYTSFGNDDPCGEEKEDCDEGSVHFEEADCCDLQQTVVKIDKKSNLDVKKKSELIQFCPTFSTFYPFQFNINQVDNNLPVNHFIFGPPEPCKICVFRI